MSFAAIFALTTFVLAAFVLSLLPFAGERKQATAYLAILLGLICLVAGVRLAVLNNYHRLPELMTLMVPLVYVHGPVVYLYTRASLFEEPWQDALRRIWFVILPMLLALGLHIYISSSYDLTWSMEGFRATEGALRVYVNVHFITGCLYMQIWVFAAFRNLARYRREFENRFSTEAAEQIRWLRLFLIFCAVWFTAPLVIAALNVVFPEKVNFADSPITVIPLLVIIYMIMQHALVRPRALPVRAKQAAAVAEGGAPDARYAKAALSAEKRRVLAERVSEALEEDQLFLEPELSLPRLAEELDAQVHHLSMVISLEFKTNFHGLVSLYRVREAVQLLRDPDLIDETILDIGFRAGFNSKAALNRAFKSHMGVSPREVRANVELSPPALPEFRQAS